MSITTRAAVCRVPGQPWEITELELDEPRANEVRIKFYAAGLCHSDDHIQKGDAPMRLPVVGGHEGAGIVDAVGASVTRVKVGDHVTCSFIPACGKCRYCSTGRQHLCDAGKNAGTGMFPDGTFRFHQGGEDFGGLCVLGTFSQYAVVHEYSVIKIPEEIGFDVAALVGLRRADGLGLGGPRGRRARRADRGDLRHGRRGQQRGAGRAPSPGRRTWSWWTRWSSSGSMATSVFGATHAFATAKEAHDFVVETTWGELADRRDHHRRHPARRGDRERHQGRGQDRPGHDHRGRERLGQREPRHADRLPAPDPGLDLRRLQPPGRRAACCIGLYQAGDLKLDELITRRYKLDEINEGYQDMLDGKNIRGVIIHEH